MSVVCISCETGIIPVVGVTTVWLDEKESTSVSKHCLLCNEAASKGHATAGMWSISRIDSENNAKPIMTPGVICASCCSIYGLDKTAERVTETDMVIARNSPSLLANTAIMSGSCSLCRVSVYDCDLVEHWQLVQDEMAVIRASMCGRRFWKNRSDMFRQIVWIPHEVEALLAHHQLSSLRTRGAARDFKGVSLWRLSYTSVMCGGCGKPGSPTRSIKKRCAKCKFAVYCDADCQKRDWNSGSHKAMCAYATQPCRPCECIQRQSMPVPGDIAYVHCSYNGSVTHVVTKPCSAFLCDVRRAFLFSLASSTFVPYQSYCLYDRAKAVIQTLWMLSLTVMTMKKRSLPNRFDAPQRAARAARPSHSHLNAPVSPTRTMRSWARSTVDIAHEDVYCGHT